VIWWSMEEDRNEKEPVELKSCTERYLSPKRSSM
jgi:hypothetical protein